MRKKINIKKWMVFLVICSMLMTVCACGKNENNDSQESVSEAENEDTTDKSGDAENDTKTESEIDADSSKAAEKIEKEEPTPEPKKEIVEEEAPLGPEEIYAQVLDAYYADIVSEFTIDNYFPMTMGTFEAVIECRDEQILDEIGYTFDDINGDGTQELLIMKVSDQGQTLYYGEQILAMYTIAQDEARFLAGGWARNRYYLLNDGRIINEGSSGADDSSFETYIFMESSSVPELIDSVNSQSADYTQQLEELKKLIEKVEIKTFKDYETTKDYPMSAKKFWSKVYADPAEKTYAMTGTDSFVATNSEYARDIVFYTPSEVTDFKFYSLTPSVINDKKVVFEEKELYSLDRLVIDKAVTITMEFVGDTPGYGISYKDAEGIERRYAIGESGFDGSIYLTKYENAQ